MAEGFESQTGEQQVLGGASGWKKLGRRWMTILTGMLLSNLMLIVLATAGYRDTEAPVQLSDLAIVTRSVIDTNSPEPEAADRMRHRSGETHAEVMAARGRQTPEVMERQVDLAPAGVSNTESKKRRSTASAASIHTVTQDKIEIAHPIAESVTDPVDFAGLVIINPAATGGTVHYVVDGQVCSLSPAEYRCFDGSKRRKVVFHKGDDLNDAEKSIHEGVFVFGVSQQGWELNPAEKDMSLRLLENCRSAE